MPLSKYSYQGTGVYAIYTTAGTFEDSYDHGIYIQCNKLYIYIYIYIYIVLHNKYKEKLVILQSIGTIVIKSKETGISLIQLQIRMNYRD